MKAKYDSIARLNASWGTEHGSWDELMKTTAYTDYLQGALNNSALVGTHWFQFGDQATTGRGDGENYQIGFLDICDTPYAEIIESSRSVGETMYSL